jgi:hypothetical protein
MLADLETEGVGTLERFTATPAQMRWYYDEVRSALGPDLPRRLLAEIDALIGRLRAFVPEASAEG